MKLIRALPLSICLTLSAAVSLQAQVVPTTPTKFGTRPLGGMSEGGGSASIGLSPGASRPQPIVKEINYIALTDSRQWTSTDDKTLIGKLLAFEQMEQVLPQGQAAPSATAAAPTLPARPTVIRQGSVRLLINQKPFELALDRLCQADRDFIQLLDGAIGKKAAATSAAAAATSPAPVTPP